MDYKDYTGPFNIIEMIEFKNFLKRHGYKIDAELLTDGVRLKWYKKGEKMTKIGYEDIKQRIFKQIVTPPNDMNSENLMGWLNGYHQAQIDILEIIDDLMKGARD